MKIVKEVEANEAEAIADLRDFIARNVEQKFPHGPGTVLKFTDEAKQGLQNIPPDAVLVVIANPQGTPQGSCAVHTTMGFPTIVNVVENQVVPMGLPSNVRRLPSKGGRGKRAAN